MTAIAIGMPATFRDVRVLRAQEGDLGAFNELVEEYQGLVYRICLRITGQVETAEDAAQETFVLAWRHLGSVRPESFRPWVCRIATNASRSQMRRVRRRVETTLDEAEDKESSEVTPETAALRKELHKEIVLGLGQLPPEQRAAIVLWHDGGLNYREIAEVMGTSTETVKSRLFRGRRRLSKLLNSSAGDLTGRVLAVNDSVCFGSRRA